jgi:adenylate kinase
MRHSEGCVARIGLIFGVSGAGKTSLAERTAMIWPVFHAVDASSFLTEDGKNYPLSSHSENQTAIVRGVQALCNGLPEGQIILLTAHALIEAYTDLVPVNLDIFDEIQPSVIFVCEEEPLEISRRRSSLGHEKITWDAGEIENIQCASSLYAKELALKLEVPLILGLSPEKIRTTFDELDREP